MTRGIFQFLSSSEVELMRVYAALAVMAVEWAAKAVLGHERRDGAQNSYRVAAGGTAASSQPSKRSGSPGTKTMAAERGLAHTPDGSGFFRRAMCAAGGEGQDCEARAWIRPWLARPRADQAPISTSRKPLHPAAGRDRVGRAFAAHEVDEHEVETLEADGLVFEGKGNGIGGETRIFEASTVSTRKGGLAVRFSVAETMLAQVLQNPPRAGDMEVVFWEQFVEVCSRRRAGYARKFFAYQGARAVANCARPA